jgi:hypothetical protein
MFSSSLSFGGYNPSASQADVPMDATQGSPQKGQLGGESHTLVPVTIHMMEQAAVSQAPGGDLRVDGRMANMMLVVGAVEDLNRQQASMEFFLNDSTGRMKARFFFPADLKLDSVQNGTYVSAVGQLKTQPSVHFSLVSLHPVQSPDQISYHMIEVAHASLRNKGKLASPEKAAAFSPQKDAPATVPRPLVSTTGPSPQPMMTAVSKPNPVPMAPAASDSAPLREQIATFLRTFQTDTGAALEELNTRFSTAGPQAVKTAIDSLLDEGEAYTTIDDTHFAVV